MICFYNLQDFFKKFQVYKWEKHKLRDATFKSTISRGSAACIWTCAYISPQSHISSESSLKCLMPMFKSQELMKEAGPFWTVYEITLKITWPSLTWTMKLRTTPWAVKILGCQNGLLEWSHHSQELLMNEQSLFLLLSVLNFSYFRLMLLTVPYNP